MATNEIENCDNPEQDGEEWYDKAEKYWKDLPPTISSMLGGHTRLLSIDVTSSRRFLQQFIKGKSDSICTRVALDCGAGIGRVSKHVLLPTFDAVDLVEMNPRFLEKSKSYLGRAAAKVGSYYCCGLQSFTPKIGHYDVIWCQWVLAHLTDEDLISFVKRCQEGLTTVGIIIVKENVTTEGKDYDHVDSSVARSAEIFRQLFTAAGLRVVQEDKQLGFPEQMYDVNMWALR